MGWVVDTSVLLDIGLDDPERIDALEEFLFQLGVDHHEDWRAADTANACKAWTRHVQKRRRHKAAKRPIADVLIGAFALRHRGLITRNVGDFRKLFPALDLIAP